MRIELTTKKEIIIRFVCILILIGLCYAVYYHGKGLTCDNCAIRFKAAKTGMGTASSEYFEYFEVRIKDMYSELLEGRCMVEFDKLMGFYVHGKGKTNITE